MAISENKQAGVLLCFALVCGAVLVSHLTSCETVKPLCRHIVRAQVPAALDAGYEVEEVMFLNPDGSKYKYHVAVRVRKPGDSVWMWLVQPETEWTAINIPPVGKILKVTKHEH